ncbi:hypothetical protein P154DRAFT_526497, partial [Amniculicola lignicola CBS 123094]
TVSNATKDLPKASTLDTPSPALINNEYYQGLDWKRVPDLQKAPIKPYIKGRLQLQQR